jgi:hypothetical protein
MPGTAGRSELPIDLHYDDPSPPSFDIERIEARGHGLRRRRRLAVAATALAVPVLAGLGALWVAHAPSDERRLGSTSLTQLLMDEPVVAANPSIGQPIAIDTGGEPWGLIAWLTRAGNRQGNFCYLAGNPRELDKVGVGGDCGSVATHLLISAEPAVYPPEFIGSVEWGPEVVPAIGVVRGDAATVEITMFGHTTTARVHRLDGQAAAPVGAYFAELPIYDHTAFGWSDLTLTARDGAGRVVARWTPAQLPHKP